nr:MAG TPA_asm: hypothetical protein [Caudoviricetes sp.]
MHFPPCLQAPCFLLWYKVLQRYAAACKGSFRLRRAHSHCLLNKSNKAGRGRAYFYRA